MKRTFLALALTFVMILTTACGSVANASKVTFEKACTFESDFQYGEALAEDFRLTNATKSEKYTKLFTEICRDEVIYLNDNFNLSYTTEDIPVYYYDFSSVDIYQDNGGMTYAVAVYVNNLNAVLISSEFANSENSNVVSDYVYGVLSHEAIHYLYKLNNNLTSAAFEITDSNGGTLGKMLTEGCAQKIALQYLVKAGHTKAYAEVYTAYTTELMLVLMMECSIPEIDNYYLTADIDGLANKVNNLIWENTTVNKSSAITPFEYLMFQSTIFTYFNSLYQTSLYYSIYEGITIPNSTEYAYYNNEMGYAILEMMFAMAQGANAENQSQLLELYDGFYNNIWFYYGENPTNHMKYLMQS